MHDELLTAAEAARYLKTTRNTVYRWCRAGTLPARKVGGVWRIPRSALEDGAGAPQGSAYPTWADVLDRIAEEESSHWLVITPGVKEVYDVDASFISRGLGNGRRVVKGSWWQRPDRIRSELAARGIQVEAAERAGALVLMDVAELYREGGVTAVASRWEELARSARELGFRGMWKTGSPALDDSAPFDGVVEVEEAAARFFHRAKAHSICPIYTADHPEWHERLTRILGSHDAAVYRSEEGNALLRLAS